MGKMSGDRLGSTGRGSAHLVLSSGKQRISNNKKESLFVQDVNSNKASHYRLSFAEIQSQSREWKVPLKNGWLRMLYLKVWAWWSQRKTNWKYGIMSYVIGFVKFSHFIQTSQPTHKGHHPHISFPNLHIRSLQSYFFPNPDNSKYRHLTLPSFLHRKIKEPETVFKILPFGRIFLSHFSSETPTPEWGCSAISFPYMGGVRLHKK